MGVIRRQSLGHSIASFLGIFIGAISTLFIYPNDIEIYGFAQFLIAGAMLLAPFALIGVNTLPVRFFPLFKKDPKAFQGYFSVLLRMAGIAMVIFLILVFIFKQPLVDFYETKSELFGKYTSYIFPLAILSAFGTFLAAYISNFGKIVVPYILSNLTRKIALPIVVILYIINLFQVQHVAYSLVFIYLIPAIGMILYLSHLGKLKLGKIHTAHFRSIRKEMIEYSFYGFLGGIGSALSFAIDSVMISTLLDFSNNGTYNIGLFIGNAIAAPTLALINISAPYISEANAQGDNDRISKLYKSSSMVLLIVGLCLFLLIITSMHDLIQLLPNSESFTPLFLIVLYLGLSKIFDMATSVNNQIILFSEHFRFNLIAVLLLGIFNVFANLLFIQWLSFGIVGAAIATALSLFLYNLVKFIFIYVKFNMQPFTSHTLKLVVFSIILFIVFYFLPLDISPIINIIIRTILLGLIYIVVVLKSNWSPEFSHLLNLYLKKILDYVK